MKLNIRFDLEVRSTTLSLLHALITLVFGIIALNDIISMGPMLVMVFVRMCLEYIQIFSLQIICKGFKTLNQHFKNRVLSEVDTTVYRNMYEDLFNMTVYFNKLFCWLFGMYLLELLLVLCISLNYLLELYWNRPSRYLMLWTCFSRMVSDFI